MIGEEQIARMIESFQQLGRDLSAMVEQRLQKLPKGDRSGWFYVEAAGTEQPDGRKTATVKPRDAPVGAGNPAIGPLPCVRSYTPVAGQRVLVTWVSGDPADGVILG